MQALSLNRILCAVSNDRHLFPTRVAAVWNGRRCPARTWCSGRTPVAGGWVGVSRRWKTGTYEQEECMEVPERLLFMPPPLLLPTCPPILPASSYWFVSCYAYYLLLLFLPAILRCYPGCSFRIASFYYGLHIGWRATCGVPLVLAILFFGVSRALPSLCCVHLEGGGRDVVLGHGGWKNGRAGAGERRRSAPNADDLGVARALPACGVLCLRWRISTREEKRVATKNVGVSARHQRAICRALSSRYQI